MRVIWLTLTTAALWAAPWTLPFAPMALSAEPSKTIEVTGKLISLPSQFPPDDLYDYAMVMKYQVIGGPWDGQILYVAHYKPRLPRNQIRDSMQKFVRGSLQSFRKGHKHKLSLDPDLTKIWKGALIDNFFIQDRKSVRYWCLKVDPAE